MPSRPSKARPEKAKPEKTLVFHGLAFSDLALGLDFAAVAWPAGLALRSGLQIWLGLAFSSLICPSLGFSGLFVL